MNRIKVGHFGFGRTGRIVAAEFMRDERFDVRWVARRSEDDCGCYASELLGLPGLQGRICQAERMDEAFHKENPVDVIVDFSDTEGVRSYQDAVRKGVAVVSAVSRYEAEDLRLLKSLAAYSPVLYSPNITLGINVLMVASAMLQKLMPHADIAIVEEHFRNKPETSGTALKIAESLGLDPEAVCSVRAGGIVGHHEIIFGMPNQTIRLVHDSISRAAFGQGAIFAANYLAGREAGLYTMDAVVTELFRQSLAVS